MKNKSIAHIRLLYLTFGGLLLLCVVLSLVHYISFEERLKIVPLDAPNTTYAYRITDLDASNALFSAEHHILNTPSGLTAHSHVNRFDVDFFSDDLHGQKSRIVWSMVLQGLGTIMVIAIIVLVVIVLISLYRGSQKGDVFPHCSIKMLTIIGILQVAMALSVGTSIYLQRWIACDLLANTDWQPILEYPIDFTLLFNGLMLIFVAQLFRIGHQLQEEQELTI